MKIKLKAALYTLILLSAITSLMVLIYKNPEVSAKVLVGFSIGVIVAAVYNNIYDRLMNDQL